MQKRSKKASILLWSIFISMIVSLLFLWISSKVNKNLKNNEKIFKQDNINYILSEKIKNNDFWKTDLWDNYYLIFEKKDPIIRTIKKNEEKTFLFNSWSQINITIKKIYWSPVYYKAFKWSDKNNINTLVSSWIIDNETNFNLLDSSNKWWKLYLKNLWWEARLKINSQNSIIPDYLEYKIVKLIWNTIITKQKNKIFFTK